MGFKCCCFSISWTRIFPTGEDEQPNEAGLAFYGQITDECLKNGIEPLITICHFELPIALPEKYGGWRDRRTITAFVRFAETLFY